MCFVGERPVPDARMAHFRCYGALETDICVLIPDSLSGGEPERTVCSDRGPGLRGSGCDALICWSVR